jgi:hypothetical protein
MNPVVVEIIKAGMQVIFLMARNNSITAAELDQMYASTKEKFLQNDPNDLPDV